MSFWSISLIKIVDIDFFVDKFIYMFKIFILISFSFFEFLLFLNVLLYYVRSFLINQEGLKLNGTYQFLAYADGVNLLGDARPGGHKASTLVYE
jgi:hypothetical protein